MRRTTSRLILPLLVALVTVPALGQDTVEDDAAPEKSAPLVRLDVKKGDRFRFRRTRTRTARCDALSRNGDDHMVQEVTATVTSRTDDGGVELSLVFGPATGHYTLDSGKRIEFDTSKALPEFESMGDLVNTRGLSFLGGATLTVTLDARGRPVREEGMRDAVRKAFAGTQMAAAAEDYPDEEALGELWPYFPPLPAPEHGDGATWQGTTTIDFGARSHFDYELAWTLAEGADETTQSAVATHVPGEEVPEGQENEGSGTLTVMRSKKDGFVTSHVIEATFTGRGKFEIDTTFEETLERLPAETE